MRKVLADAWIISLAAGMTLLFYDYSVPNDPPLIAFANIESQIGTALNLCASAYSPQAPLTTRLFSWPIGVTVRSEYSGAIGFRSAN